MGYLLGRNYRRRDRDHLVPPRRMDAAVCRAEVCYPFGREHGRHRAVRRREFITVLGGAAATWPLAARAQQPTRRIGMLIGYSENDPEIQARLVAFRQALEGNGWKVGRSVLIDYRFAPAGPDQAQVFAKELVALQPDVLVGNSTPATAALLHETRTIPIVFVGV